MLYRRCAHLMVELDHAPRFDVASLLSGGDGLDRGPRWLARAPHLPGPVDVTLEDLSRLSRLPEADWLAAEAVDDALGAIRGALREVGGEMIVTADHGNLEMMRDPETGQPHTSHTVGPVPFVYFGRQAKALHAGGALRYIPCLNERHDWIAALTTLTRRHLTATSTDPPARGPAHFART